MSDELQSFETFLKQRDDIASAYVRGDGEPLKAIATEDLPATFFGPGGGFRQGAREVTSTYMEGAAAFEPGGESQLEILHTAASRGIAYWVGLQKANVKMKHSPEPVAMTLRITEVFRREGDDWKLVHRHADGLAEEKKPGR